MNPAFVAVVRAWPSVCSRYPTNIRAPRISPGHRTSRRRRPCPEPARRINGTIARIARKPSVLDHAMNVGTGSRRRAIFVAGKVAPHSNGVRRRKVPASTRRRTIGTISQKHRGSAAASLFPPRSLLLPPGPPLQLPDREGHLLHHDPHLLSERRSPHRARPPSCPRGRRRPLPSPPRRPGHPPDGGRRTRVEAAAGGRSRRQGPPDLGRRDGPPLA